MGMMFLQNVCDYLQDYMPTQPRRPQFTVVPSQPNLKSVSSDWGWWKLQNEELHIIILNNYRYGDEIISVMEYMVRICTTHKDDVKFKENCSYKSWREVTKLVTEALIGK
jgi:hypothetical protein